MSLILTLIVQVVLILALSRAMGSLATRLRQPKVVGEMLAGIMLGPSLLGLLFPEAAAAIFPPASVQLLNVLAQIGVIFFLFLIGLELDPKQIRDRGHTALLISHVSIIAPFVFGAAITLLLYPQVFNDSPNQRFTPVALFMGAAMSITAFPVLARILTERGLQKTKLGSVAITCAAIDDVSAWCMLAFVVAISRAQGLGPGIMTAGLSLAYVALMFFLVRPGLRQLEALYEQRPSSSQTIFSIVLLLILISAGITEWIGIHALFGAFMLGAIMPKNSKFVHLITGRLEDFTVIFLLPIFFAYAGLRTQIGLLDNWHLWLLTALIIVTACLGKFGGSALAARATGMSWRESSAIGILMNTRGLMELVILTIGLQIGVITDAVFAMMVIMALVTTAMTTPILAWVYPQKLFEADPVDDATAAAEFGVLVPISRPGSAPNLAKLVSLINVPESPAKVYGVTLSKPSRNESLGIRSIRDEGDDAMAVLATAAAGYKLRLDTISVVSRDVASDIGHIARAKKADLILMGFHKPLFGNNILGGTVHRVLTGADSDVAIFVDRGLPKSLRVLLPYQGSPHDQLALSILNRMSRAASIQATILELQSTAPTQGALSREAFAPSVNIVVDRNVSPLEAVMKRSGEFDLVITGADEDWGDAAGVFGRRSESLVDEWESSLLLLRKHIPIESTTPVLLGAASH